MIPFAQFDPATLSIWTTTGGLLNPIASVAAETMRKAVRGEPVYELIDGAPPEWRGRLLWLCSSVWHEKRHFFDTCLTNYGARRFRDLFNLAANFGPLVAHAHHAGEPVCFPVEIYDQPIFRRRLGISQPPDNIIASAHLARMLKSTAARLDAPMEYEGASVHLGGGAQMEGLGQASQLHGIELMFGIDDLRLVTAEHVHRLAPEGPYRAIETVATLLGCTKQKGSVTLVKLALASAVFVTALCGRFLGAGESPAADLISPSDRLARMIVELGKSGNFEMSDEEAAERVDTLARRLWGRTALEEIGSDIDIMETKLDLDVAPWLREDGMAGAFEDFIAMRRRLLSAAVRLGSASLLPRAFPIHWCDKLQPWHIEATPAGSSAGDAPIVFGTTINVPRGYERLLPTTVAWGRLHTDATNSDDVFAPNARFEWLEMLERHGPRALLMLNGRKHRRMLPPELERPIAEIKQWDVPVRFHPQFEWPAERSDQTRQLEAVAVAEFCARATFTCDLTGEELEPSAAAVLTPWELRNSRPLEKFRQSSDVFRQFQLATDWSDWIVKRDLLTG